MRGFICDWEVNFSFSCLTILNSKLPYLLLVLWCDETKKKIFGNKILSFSFPIFWLCHRSKVPCRVKIIKIYKKWSENVKMRIGLFLLQWLILMREMRHKNSSVCVCEDNNIKITKKSKNGDVNVITFMSSSYSFFILFESPFFCFPSHFMQTFFYSLISLKTTSNKQTKEKMTLSVKI